MTYLPDVNVRIALAAERHKHHSMARQWFIGLRDADLAFCRVTQMGFLRLLTNAHVMQKEVLTPDGATRMTAGSSRLQ
jgi:predicted nucleic acid-binding protein